MKFLFSILIVLFTSFSALAEDLPARWRYSYKYLTNGKVELTFTASIDSGWHIYSQDASLTLPGGNTEFVYKLDSTSALKINGIANEPEGHQYFDKDIGQELKEFEHEAVFTQIVDASALTEDETLNGEIFWIVCEAGGVCKFPQSPTKFSFLIEADKIEKEEQSFLGIFLAGFLGGLVALLTPCVFPMIPMTVSFFTKQSKNRAQGIRNALIYGLSIIGIYVALGLGVTLSLGPEILNGMSTSVIFNLFFFVLLIVFAASFLGAFEITLPNSWINKADSNADKGGLIGIFFMAFTLALVSFSCTGPVIGTLLVEASQTGVSGPFFGMLGFSSALALPFTLFAIFPGWMNSLPQSGGWLNSVKVVLGLLEIALAMKFLSNADLVAQWGIITREVFIAIWIVVFGFIGLYLLGKFKMPHDSDLKHVSVFRLFLAIFFFSFVTYLVPGMFGAPLKIISGFPPPSFYSEGWSIGVSSNVTHSSSGESHSNASHCPNGLNCFHDYEEGLAYAKEVNKPVLLDFTGWACVNCRKMESQVWTEERIDKILRDDYVLISLYVDEKKDLDPSEVYTNKEGNEVNQVGEKWMDFQITRYGTATQPYYRLVDFNGEDISTEAKSYDTDVDAYEDFLKSGISAFESKYK